jgi:RNA polymerase sigma-70 factor (ECF subfamily)
MTARVSMTVQAAAHLRRTGNYRLAGRTIDPNALLPRSLCLIAQRSAMVGPAGVGEASLAPHAGMVFDLMADLLRRVAERAEPAAFRELYQTYGPRVKAYMMRCGADSATADDLVQDTLLTVWRKAALYADDRGSIATWVFTIARNLRIDRLRRELPWQQLPDERLQEASSDMPADEALYAKERQRRVGAVLAELPDEQRTVVTLSFVDGLSHSAIAEQLSLPLGTVKSRLRLAYQRIRESLGDLQ